MGSNERPIGNPEMAMCNCAVYFMMRRLLGDAQSKHRG
jgi:hypothetical protein